MAEKKQAILSPTQVYLNWLEERITYRLQQQFAAIPPATRQLKLPKSQGKDVLHQFILDKQLQADEVLLLLLALAPHLDPIFFDRIIPPLLPDSGDFPQLGGYRGQAHRGFLPSGITFLFLADPPDWSARQRIIHLFSDQHLFASQQVLELGPVPPGEPSLSGGLILQEDFVPYFTSGIPAAPKLSIQFPARRLHTQMEWTDVVLPPATLKQVQEVQLWLEHQKTIMEDWHMSARIKPGYKVLFYGPSGTGKTLTAALLGKYTGREVYAIDLSVVVSKYIGETEKNLSRLFERAANKDWILFFDEADALFGKRTQVRDAHDKYANQEVAYLLQRIETFDGLVILASNAKANIDQAFVRRFQSIIHFPMPAAAERQQIWQEAIPSALQCSSEVDLNLIARKYELSGASIVNVIQHCCLLAAASGQAILDQELLLAGIRREMLKESKVWQEC